MFSGVTGEKPQHSHQMLTQAQIIAQKIKLYVLKWILEITSFANTISCFSISQKYIVNLYVMYFCTFYLHHNLTVIAKNLFARQSF